MLCRSDYAGECRRFLRPNVCPRYVGGACISPHSGLGVAHVDVALPRLVVVGLPRDTFLERAWMGGSLWRIIATFLFSDGALRMLEEDPDLWRLKQCLQVVTNDQTTLVIVYVITHLLYGCHTHDTQQPRSCQVYLLIPGSPQTSLDYLDSVRWQHL